MRLLSLLFCLIVPILAQAAPPQGKNHALLVGVTEYSSDRFTPLKYTENDVEALARVLDRPGSPFRGNVRVLTCTRGKKNSADAPTAANIRAAFARLIAGRGKRDTVLLALSGHGTQLDVKAPNDEGPPRSHGYFCPADADLADIKYSTGRAKRLILVSGLLEELERCGAGARLVLMDACRNEVTARGSRNVDVERVSIPRGLAVLFSCSRGQRAFETDKLGRGHGVFFYHVIEALQGKGQDEDGEVDWAGLSRYVTRRVMLQVPKLIGGGAEQTPHEVKNLAGRLVLLPAAARPAAERAFRRGLALLQGRDEPIDETRAVKHFRLSAQAGHALARAELALCCWRGQGTSQDRAEALRQARQALPAVRAAAGKGDADARYALAGLYRFGVGVAKDEKEALRWYGRAAGQGHVAAMTSLAKLHLGGLGTARDAKRAVEWLRKAADSGHPGAMTDLGVLHAAGQGVAEDAEEAVRWYRQAAARAHPRAMYNLGLCHEKAWGVERDEKEALRWYRRAAALGHAGARAALQRLEKRLSPSAPRPAGAAGGSGAAASTTPRPSGPGSR